MQDGQMMQTPAAKRQDVEGAQQQQQQQQQLTAARAISAEATAAKKSRSDPLPSGKKARCRPSKDTMEGWGDTICSSTKKKPVGNAEDPMFKAPFLRKEWLNIVEKAQNSAEWDAALAKGWIKPADMGGKKHDKQCEVCSSLCPLAPLLPLPPLCSQLPHCPLARLPLPGRAELSQQAVSQQASEQPTLPPLFYSHKHTFDLTWCACLLGPTG